MKNLIDKRFLRTVFGVLLILGIILTASSELFAFTCHRETRGELTFEISKIDALTSEGEIYHAPLSVVNDSDQDVSIVVRFSSIDGVYLYDESGKVSKEFAPTKGMERTFTVKAKETLKSTVAFAVRGTYRDAHYPIRADFSYELNGKKEIVELRPVFTVKLTSFLPTSKLLKPLALEKKSFLRLTGSNVVDFAPFWKQDGGKINPLSVGWTGVQEDSKCSFNPCSMTRSGVARSSWSIHPPYAHGPGSIGLRFVVQTPEAKKLELRFFRAMRDVFAPEPPTDGVLFRVYATVLEDLSQDVISKALSEELDPSNVVFEDQYDGVSWLETNVDLSRFANKSVLLTFEADPGSKRDTTCDNCFWGDVVLTADPNEQSVLTVDERKALQKQNADEFKRWSNLKERGNVPSSGKKLSENSRGFDLDDGQYAVVTLGQYGVCDGWVAIGAPDKFVQIDGVRAQYQGVNVGFERALSSCEVVSEFVESTDLESSAYLFVAEHGETIIGDVPVDSDLKKIASIKKVAQPDTTNALRCFVSQTKGGLAFRFVASHNAEIEALQFGAFSEKASRVYFGHGHCIVEPKKAFSQSGDGFGCASSHVGFDFENGLSVLEATTRPVSNFVVDPDLQIYTLSTSPDSRLTLRSSCKGALDCAMKYAPGFDKNPAPLVPKKSGRFVYDYWGGSYASILDRMKTFVDYGLVDSLLIQHVWQHYGYDVRLPDIWPPRTEQGTLEELKETQKFCDRYNIPFGLHDNYIDFYPDADGFTYDDIIIDPDGLPQKAWYNPGPDVQSYRFNPTKIFPYAKRNLDLIRKDLMQTAYFTDVFSSIHIMNFYDVDGKFHTRAETLDSWNKYFDLVREKFNNNAITISESGNDALIGHLEGADAILRRITSTQENYSTVIESKECEYVPWFDAVNHARFILHGVGYSDRYEGGIARSLRGIESDDYISSEALTGHAIMADLAMSERGTVRKYWLMQNQARSLAMDEIVGFEFVNDDVHRQKIVWKSGVTVYVNRGVEDWTIDSLELPDCSSKIVLPRFGFWSVNDDGSSYGGIVRLNDQVVEMRVDGNSYFVNGRESVPHQATGIRPSFENVEIIDGKSLRGDLVWNAYKPTDKPYTPFLHLERPKTWWADKPELNVLPLTEPNKSSDKWNGRETELFGGKIGVNISDEIEPGYYNLLCGLFDVKSGRRLQLLGTCTSDLRVRLGAIVVEGRGEKRKITFEPVAPLYDVDMRLVSNDKPTNFGMCETKGAFRFEQKDDASVVITPLPDEPPFDVRLTSAFFQNGTFDVIECDRSGAELKRSSVSAVDHSVTISVDSGTAFSYKIVKK